MKEVYKPTTTNCCGGFCGLESDIFAVDLPRLNVAGGASVATHAGCSDLFKNLGERFCFILDAIQCAAGRTHRFMAATGGKTKDGLEFVRADVVTSRL